MFFPFTPTGEARPPEHPHTARATAPSPIALMNSRRFILTVSKSGLLDKSYGNRIPVGLALTGCDAGHDYEDNVQNSYRRQDQKPDANHR